MFRQTSAEGWIRVTWPCKDGYINFMIQGGTQAKTTRALLQWMDEEGMGDEFLKSVPWEELGYGYVPEEVMDRATEPLERFFTAHTKEELTKGSADRRVLLFPVATQKDLLDHPHLEARHYFQQVHHPELGAPVTYPAGFIKAGSGVDTGIRRRAPLLGEHSLEIFENELGLTGRELANLKDGGVI